MDKSIIFLVGILALAVPIWLVSNRKSERVTFVAGCTLAVFGLAGSLWLPYWLSASDEAARYLSNGCIIIASIGANFIASAALLGNVGQYSSEEKFVVKIKTRQRK